MSENTSHTNAVPARAFQTVLMSSVWSTEPDRLSRFCKEARKLGATGAVANILPDPYPLHVLEQPSNPYVWFTTWGPSLDQFVSSELTYGLYPEVYLGRNRATMHRVVDILASNGIQPWLFCGEPRFLPERFYRVYPHLRGPRVDNPNCSATPLYAPCTDFPEIHEHYREMMQTLMQEFPTLQGLILYSGDSGTGICHSESLYAGRNGPRFCMDTHPGEKIRRLVVTLLEAAQTVNPEFRVYLGHYIWSDERQATYREGPPDAGGWLNGYFCCGGLEDCYANLQYPGKIDEVGYDQARTERLQVMADQLAEIKKYDRPYIVPTTAPMEEWLRPMQMVPNPYQAVEMLQALRGIGAEHLAIYSGNDPTCVEYDINTRAVQAFMKTPEKTSEEIVREIAEEWVGPSHATTLCRAWKMCDEACRKRPLYSYTFGSSSYPLAPMVPDDSLVSEKERRYYDRPSVFRDGKVRSEASWITHLCFDESYRDWMVKRFREIPLPLLAEAQSILFAERDSATSEETRRCLDFQARYIGSFGWFLRCQYNWLEIGRYHAPGPGTVKFERSLTEIIDDEIESTVHLIDLIRPHAEKYLIIGNSTLGQRWGPGYLEKLEKRVEVMQHHRNDSPQPREGQ